MRLRLAAVMVSLLAGGTAAAEPTQESLLAEARAQAIRFEEKFGVPIEWIENAPPEGIRVEELHLHGPNPSDLVASLPALINELSIYPEGFVRGSGLKKILLSRGITRAGKDLGGLAFAGGPRAGTLLVSITAIRHASRTIHHELFHLVQQNAEARSRNSAWGALNPPGFVYGAPIPPSGLPKSFITQYATSTIKEDQADVFAWLVADQASVVRAVERDEALGRKVALMKELVAAIESDFDDALWARMAGRRAGDPL